MLLDIIRWQLGNKDSASSVIVVCPTLADAHSSCVKYGNFCTKIGVHSNIAHHRLVWFSKDRLFNKTQEVFAGGSAKLFVDHAVFDDDRIYNPSIQKLLREFLPHQQSYYSPPEPKYRLIPGGGLVHETSYVENSVIGRGVKVGPHSVVIDSTLTGATHVFKANVRYSTLHDTLVGESTLYSALVSKSRLEESEIRAQRNAPTQVIQCTLDHTFLNKKVYARHVRFEYAEVLSDLKLERCLVSKSRVDRLPGSVFRDKHITGDRSLPLKDFFVDENFGYTLKMQEQDMNELDVQKSLLEEREKALIQREIDLTDREAHLGKQKENFHVLLEASKKRVQELEANLSEKMEKNTMSQNTGYDAFKNTGSAMGSAILNGGKMAGANKLNNTLRDLFKRILMRQGFTREELDHPAVNATLKLAAPFILKYATEKFPQIFGGEKIAPVIGSAAEKAMEAAVYEIAMPILEEIGPDLLEIKNQATALVSDAPRVSEAEKEDVITRTAKVSEREKDPAPTPA